MENSKEDSQLQTVKDEEDLTHVNQQTVLSPQTTGLDGLWSICLSKEHWACSDSPLRENEYPGLLELGKGERH